MQTYRSSSPRTLTHLLKWAVAAVFCHGDGNFTATGTDTDLVIGTPLAVVGGDPVLFDADASDGSEDIVGLSLTCTTIQDGTSEPIVWIENGPAIISEAEIDWPATMTPTQITAAKAVLISRNFKFVTPVGSTN